jgi:type I restriction enzyme S subunit
MGLKPEYSQTEVGMIPHEWDVRQVSGVLEKSRSIRYGIVQPGKFDPRGCLMLRSQDYSKGWARPDEMHRVNGQLENQYRNARIRQDDLIMTIVGAGIGQIVIAPDWLDGAILSRSTARIAVDENQASRAFVKASLESPVGTRQILDCQKEGAQPVVSCRDLAKFFIPYPPLPEQRAIARVLRDVDALIAALEQLIAKKRDLKQATMQTLFAGRKRLPGFSGEWKSKRLGECLLSRPDYGINAPAVPFSDRLPAYIRITDISEHGRFSPDPRVSVKAPNADQFYLNEGDLVFARTGASVGKSYLYDASDGQLVFAGFLIRVKLNPEMLIPGFLAAYVATRSYWNWVRMMSMRSGQAGINGNEYAQLPIPLPSVPEQTAIAGVLSDMDEELAALEQRLAKTRAVKQGMMQELLTGRTRLI